jgi:hypothetical protein
MNEQAGNERPASLTDDDLRQAGIETVIRLLRGCETIAATKLSAVTQERDEAKELTKSLLQETTALYKRAMRAERHAEQLAEAGYGIRRHKLMRCWCDFPIESDEEAAHEAKCWALRTALAAWEPRKK